MNTLERRMGHLEREYLALVPPAELAVRTPADLVALMETTINEVRSGQLDIRTAATIGGLASVALKAMEVGEMAARLEALTAVLEPERRLLVQGRR